MSETTWTKGPWLVDPENSTGVIAQHEIDTPDTGGICCCNATFWQRPLSECNANAHLIASAPELYEALEALEAANDALSATRSDRTYESMLGDGAEPVLESLDVARRRARSALSRARGEGT